MSILSHQVAARFKQERQKYNFGWACEAACADLRMWLASNNIISQCATTCIIVTDNPPLVHNGGQPGLQFKVVTRKFKLINECFWVETEMQKPVKVFFSAIHKVLPMTFIDMPNMNVLIDFSIDQFPTTSSELTLYS